ncbi:MAG: TIGR03936 family radical SAM-associated protein [Actinomycetota bacterium]|nr:TIGR03936 family radical SAM-associated protein [Actinomycetota bacterium]MDA8279339.1 TIGR03936 family radical SAM-associated protein [Actinomycetota bacterium]
MSTAVDSTADGRPVGTAVGSTAGGHTVSTAEDSTADGRPVGTAVGSTAGPAGPNPSTMVRVRARFAKLGKVRWTSHRDVARMWERALRRAGLPVAYSGGFSPHPLLSFGLALPTGCESTAEYVDVVLDPDRSRTGGDTWWTADPGEEPEDWATRMAAGFPAHLTPLLPGGVDVIAARSVTAGTPSLQQAVTSCTWRIDVPGDPAPLVVAVETALAAGSLLVSRERKGRTEVDDLRPSLLAMRVVPDAAAERATLTVETATRPRGVRPAEIASVLGASFGTACRTHQWIERDGSQEEPVVTRPALGVEMLGCAS